MVSHGESGAAVVVGAGVVVAAGVVVGAAHGSTAAEGAKSGTFAGAEGVVVAGAAGGMVGWASTVVGPVATRRAVVPASTQRATHRRPGVRGARRWSDSLRDLPSFAGTRQVAAWIQGHWRIENRPHWVRDVTFDEDRSTIRTGSGPQVMATFRNTVIGWFRLTGITNIAAALRHHGRDPHRPIDLLLSI
ncbi:hypothetical protein [Rhodococcus ruber]|uniref:hypothetical protein n=1 Tax=Rhodococcus ruber TaxID=1830 RepID=UPI003B75D3BA